MNKTVLITGSSKGIGAEIAKKLSEEGYKVFLTGRNENKLKEVADLINAAGYFAIDLTEDGATQKLIKEVENKVGSVDILVSNAGVYEWGSITSPLPSLRSSLPSPDSGEGPGVRSIIQISPQTREKMLEIARDLRKKQTKSEEILWEALKNKQILDKKFRRQHPIGTFVVDFYCPSAKLVIEVDGGIHEDQKDLDVQRQEVIESLGIRFLRIPSELVENNLDSVIEQIEGCLTSPLQLCSLPSLESGEGLWVKSFSNSFKLNSQVPLELCSLVVPSMKEKRWGRIINIGSISGVVGEPNASIYSASKAAIIGMTKSLALELAEFGITINCVNPGWVKTEMSDSVFKTGKVNEQEELDTIPQKRWIEPIEIAEMAAYLASDKAKGITGQSISICAGLSLG